MVCGIVFEKKRLNKIFDGVLQRLIYVVRAASNTVKGVCTQERGLIDVIKQQIGILYFQLQIIATILETV